MLITPLNDKDIHLQIHMACVVTQKTDIIMAMLNKSQGYCMPGNHSGDLQNCLEFPMNAVGVPVFAFVWLLCTNHTVG